MGLAPGVVDPKSPRRPIVIEALLTALREGNHRTDAAHLAGISLPTLYKLFETDPEFTESVLRAEAECKQRHIQRINKAGGEDWRAASWMLERRFPGQFGERRQINLTQLSPEQVTRMLGYAMEQDPEAYQEALDAVFTEEAEQEPAAIAPSE